MHNFKGTGSDASYRHGDLKPENILIFNDSTMLGILKIADMGSAELHATRTRERGGTATMTRFGTIHYEPPEVVTGAAQPQSRLYDIWSMGCIILEFLIWLLYGLEEQNRFYESVQAGNLQLSPFFQTHTTDGRPVAVVHPVVTTWMDYIQNDPECRRDSAIKDLILLVRNQLLVVSLPSQSPLEDMYASPSGLYQPVIRGSSFRATAKTLCSMLDRILDKVDDDSSYLFTGYSRRGVRGPSPSLPREQTLLSLPSVSIEKPVSSLLIKIC
jgi:serine/threonine protein kinase